MYYTNSDDSVVFNAKTSEYVHCMYGTSKEEKRDLLNYVIMRDDNK